MVSVNRNTAAMIPECVLNAGQIYASGQSYSEAPLEWYAVQTRPRHEKRIAEQLRATCVEEFLPLHRCRHRWKNGVVTDLNLPLFPGYLFARSSSREKIRLLQLPGVVGLAISSSHPTAVPEADIQALRTLLLLTKAEPHPFLSLGDRVRVVAGPMTGMEGVLTRKKQELRVVLTLEIIMRSISVEVGEFDVEPIPGRRGTS